MRQGGSSVFVEIPMTDFNFDMVVTDATTPEHVMLTCKYKDRFIVMYLDENSLGEALSRYSGLVKHRILH